LLVAPVFIPVGSFEADWRPVAASAAASLVVGLAGALILWSSASSLAEETEDPAEYNAPSRKLVLYGGATLGSAAALASLAALATVAFQVVFGQPVAGWQDIWRAGVALPLAALPVGLAGWIGFAWAIRSDRHWEEELRSAERPWRIHLYLMAAMGLAGLCFGLTELLVAGLVRLLPVGLDAGPALVRWRLHLALGAALVLVYGPVWLINWRAAQLKARRPGASRDANLASPARGIYLTAVIVGALAAAIAALGLMLYRWIGPQAGDLTTPEIVAQGVAGPVLALVLAIVHGMMLAADQRLRVEAAGADEEVLAAPESVLEAEVEQPRDRPGLGQMVPDAGLPEAPATAQAPDLSPASSPPADVSGMPLPGAAVAPPATASVFSAAGGLYDRAQLASVRAAMDQGRPAAETRPPEKALEMAVMDGGDGALGAALIGSLRSAFPRATLRPVGLTADAQAAMMSALGEGEPAMDPAGALQQARIILLREDLFIGGNNSDVEALVRASQASKLLLPPLDARVHWVGAPAWPQERWVAEAVLAVQRLVSAGRRSPRSPDA